MISLECRISWLTWCQDAPNYSWAVNMALWTGNLKLGTLTLLCIFLLYPFNPDINVITSNPLHHWGITTWCSDDVMISFGGKICTCAWSPEWKWLLWVDTEVDTIVSPFMKAEMMAPGTYHAIYIHTRTCTGKLSIINYQIIKLSKISGATTHIHITWVILISSTTVKKKKKKKKRKHFITTCTGTIK